MHDVTLFEYDALIAGKAVEEVGAGVHVIPAHDFRWLKARCLSMKKAWQWLTLTRRCGQEALRTANYAGIVRCPSGLQLEILPKTGRAAGDADRADHARRVLMRMLACLPNFRHLRLDTAERAVASQPLWEIFIGEALAAMAAVIKHGLRRDYRTYEGNLFLLRGKLLPTAHLRHNLFRADRFYTAHDEYSPDRAENRLLHSAVLQALQRTRHPGHQRLARELRFALADIPPSTRPGDDFARVRFERGMGYYREALAWAQLLLAETNPLGDGRDDRLPALLFPMEALFEAYVAQHLTRTFPHLRVHTQHRKHGLLTGDGPNRFLCPDLVLSDAADGSTQWVLDCKWKVPEGQGICGVASSDLYQLLAYGINYYDDRAGKLALVYPQTAQFSQPLPVQFRNTQLQLWLLPFDCDAEECRLLLPDDYPPAQPPGGIKTDLRYAGAVD